MRFVFLLAISFPCLAQIAVNGGVKIKGGVAVPTASCGPPRFLCSNSALATFQLPRTLPNVGKLTQVVPGTNTIVTPTEIVGNTNRISRITDANTDLAFANITYTAGCGGSQGQLTFNTNSTMIVVCNTNVRSYPMTFNAATMQAAKLYIGAAGFPNGYFIRANVHFSRNNPYLAYTLAGTTIQGYCFADMVAGACPSGGPLDTTHPPSRSNGRIFDVYDFKSSNSCLGTKIFPGGFIPDWANFGQMSANDSVFEAAFSYDISGVANVTNRSTDVTWSSGTQFSKRYQAGNTLVLGGVGYGITKISSPTDITIRTPYAAATGTISYTLKGFQGTAVNVVVYKVGSGCTMMNTETGLVTSDFGGAGTVREPDRYTLHVTFLSKSGTYVALGNTSCLSATCPNLKTLEATWQIGTSIVSYCSGAGCSGHWTEGGGYNHLINNTTSPWQDSFSSRPFNAMGTQTCFFSCGNTATPSGLSIPWDNHPSWNNGDAADNYPFVTSSFMPKNNSAMRFALDREIFSVDPTNGAIHRFAHTYGSGNNSTFEALQNIGQVSQDGRFFIWTSDWQGSLGAKSGGATCTTNCRADVFVVELK